MKIFQSGARRLTEFGAIATGNELAYRTIEASCRRIGKAIYKQRHRAAGVEMLGSRMTEEMKKDLEKKKNAIVGLDLQKLDIPTQAERKFVEEELNKIDLLEMDPLQQ